MSRGRTFRFNQEAFLMHDSPLPLRFDIQVPPDGRIEVQLPQAAGSQVTMYVVEQQDGLMEELAAASVSSTDFWNNPEDDEDWNNA
jgi:hypothetical protein